MILKGSQRGGARQLAAHLLDDRDNDHVRAIELRGFVAEDLHGAMAETHAIAKGTRCTQCVFSLSLNPPKGFECSLEALVDAVERAERALGLDGQPRAVVVHEKNGRRHAHVVWSRINAQTMTAVPLPFTHNRLKALSKELYLEHGWTLPDGHRDGGWKNPLNFTLEEWQQAKRQDMDPRELKQLFGQAWQEADGVQAFRAALEDKGFYLAKGDRRGFVAVDTRGEVYALARWLDVRAKELSARLGSPETLPSVAATQARIDARMTDRLKEYLRADDAAKQAERAKLAQQVLQMRQAHRTARARQTAGQTQRQQQEQRERAARFRGGMTGLVLDVVTLRYFRLRKRNADEAFASNRRDATEREALHKAQLKERAALQDTLDALRQRHRTERMEMAARVAQVWKDMETRCEPMREGERTRHHDTGRNQRRDQGPAPGF